MKYIKEFEKINVNKPKVGDYVVSDDKYYTNNDIRYFFKNTIGKIIKVYKYSITVKYDEKDIPQNTDIIKYFDYDKTNGYIRGFGYDCIGYFSKNKSDVEIYIQANKYNL